MNNQHETGRRGGVFQLFKPTEVETELPFQLVGVGCDFYQYSIDRPFGFHAFQWIQTIKGSGIMQIGGSEFEVKSGDGMLIYPGVAHSYQPVSSPWYVNWITFSGNMVEGMLKYAGVDKSGVIHLSNPLSVESRIRKAYKIISGDDYLRGLDGSGIIYNILLDYIKYVEKDGNGSHSINLQRLKPVLDLIDRELDRPLTLDDMAGSIGVTPQYFCELFKTITSQRPIEYLNQKRIERAEEYLIHDPHLSIHEIAVKVGFESDSYFSSVFKRIHGVSPRKFRTSKIMEN